MKLSSIQSQIKAHDHSGDKGDYLLKLMEEVGELAKAIRNGNDGQPSAETMKGSVAEELNDVLYYVCALANVHGVNLEKTYELKEAINKGKYDR